MNITVGDFVEALSAVASSNLHDVIVTLVDNRTYVKVYSGDVLQVPERFINKNVVDVCDIESKKFTLKFN